MRTRPASLTLGVLAASFVAPKLLLVAFFRELWLSLTPGDLVRVCLQDVAFAIAVAAVLDALLASARPPRFAVAGLLSSLLFAATLLDVRARELWLQPTSLELVRYGLAEESALRSGLQLFFDLRAGWGMTFRRALVVLTGAHALLWVALVLAARRGGAVRPSGAALARRPLVLAVLSLCLLVVAGRAGGRYRYDLQDHLVTRAALLPLRASEPLPPAAQFEQPPRPAADVLRGERVVLAGVRPFRSVAIVFLESVRWRDFAGPDAPMPVLQRLSREGMVSRCYAAIPHSSKGYYAVLSGRYPYPGIEMREAFALEQPGLLEVLRTRDGLETSVFASLSLAFENTGGMLRSLGARHLFQTPDLARAQGEPVAALSSFGSQDGPLYRLAAQRLAARRAPFAAVFLPTAAHYPYSYPGKPPAEGATHAAYLHALRETDRLLGDLVAQLSSPELADTLLVLVGDHGESFGEHGVSVHNSSLHEEEITVPLVFWSADGRLSLRRPLAPSRQIDVAPTVLDLMGLASARLPVQGVSLLRTGARPPAFLATFIDDLALGLADPPRKYIYELAGDRLLSFDLAADPEERRPEVLTGDAKAALLARLRAYQAYQRAAFPPAGGVVPRAARTPDYLSAAAPGPPPRTAARP